MSGLSLVIPVLLAIISAVGAYWIAARQFSGKIQTSEATSLWEESSSIRQWSAERINALEARVEALEGKNDDLLDENRKLLYQNNELRTEREELKGQIQTLERELDKLRGRLVELEGEINGRDN